jgi:integrase
VPLTAKAIAKLIREAKGGTPTHDANGTYLQVGESGASWLQRLTVNGKRRWMGLGSYPDVSLADARELGKEARSLARKGVDPIAARKSDRSASVVLSVETALTTFLATHKAEWRSAKTAARFRQVTKFAEPIAKLPVNALRHEDVLAVLKPEWASKTTSMVRLRSWLFLALESTRGRDGGLREDQRNPCDWARLKHDLASPRKIAKPKHHAALDWRCVPDFMGRLRDIDGVIARTLEFAILTCVRSGAVLQARWDEINLDAAIWTIPGDHEKSGQPHRVPLSDRPLAILRELGPSNGLVFPGLQGQQSNTNMLSLLRRLGVIGVTVHGFRSSFRDWAGETTSHDADICEAALSHRFNGTRGSYQRGDLFAKRRVLLSDWDRYCSGMAQMDRAA